MVYHSSSNRHTLSGMPSLQCSYAFCYRTYTGLLLHSFCYAFCGMATCTASSTTHNFFSPFQRGHSLHLCPFSPHLKHSTSTVSCLLIVFSPTPHCITLLDNTSYLFWGVTPLSFFSSLLLQFWARCPNPLQYQHILPLLPFNSALSLARVHFWLSKLLMRELYCSRDMVLCLQRSQNRSDLT